MLSSALAVVFQQDKSRMDFQGHTMKLKIIYARNAKRKLRFSCVIGYTEIYQVHNAINLIA